MAHQHTILVPVSPLQASLDAVAAACTYGRQRRSKVFVVHVIEVIRSLPLNAELGTEARRGEQLLRRAEEAASAAGHAVVGELLQAREAGQAIVDEARERDVDVVMLGIGPQGIAGDHALGRTADFVLRHASCDVWLLRRGKHADGEHEHE